MMHLIWTLNIDGKSHPTECLFPRSQCMLLVGQQTKIDLLLYMYNLIVDEAWSMHDTSLPYGVFLTKFLMDRGVIVSDGEPRTPIDSALNKATMSRSKGQGSIVHLFGRRAAALIQHHRHRHTWEHPEQSHRSFMNGWMPSNASLATATDEIEAIKAVKEKDLQDFSKKQAEMEATLQDHSEEQRVEQERIRKEQEGLRVEISKKLEQRMATIMEKKMHDMSKRLFSQFGGRHR
ncbi:hypothetical protein CJ030_MR1G025756 [Morella rubra]|uniref:Uncharacterized protein n=1 Tax=Morella rubra TaxID=262757 RepID=A0A6A1WJ37_9ROSI|nr:hypothetical protein CJ030_MR1G025756 [Morella rubra]